MPSEGNFYLVLNIFSASAACLILLTVIAITLYQRRLANRVTFRLQAAVAIANIINHVSELHFITNKQQSNCTLIEIFRYIGIDLFCLYNTAIVINLQYTYVLQKTPGPIFELCLWIIPLILVLLSNCTLFIVGLIEKRSKDLICLILLHGHENLIDCVLKLFVLQTVVVCFVFLLFFGYRFLKNNKEHKKLLDRLNQTMCRIALYPLVCAIILFGNFLYITLLVTYNRSEIPELIQNWSNISLHLLGLFSLIGFLFDPSLQYAIKLIFNKGIYKNQHSTKSPTNKVDNTETTIVQQMSIDCNLPISQDENNVTENEFYTSLIKIF